MISSRSHDQIRRLNGIEVFALDLDGTLYLGEEIFSFTLTFLERLRRFGKRYVFVTNNSAYNQRDYVLKLSRMKIETTLDDIYTSGRATIDYLLEQGGPSPVFLLGTESLDEQFRESGFETLSPNPDYVVLGFDLTFTWQKLNAACRFIRNGAKFIATHPDKNCPVSNRDLLPDCGALIAAFEAATGVSPLVIGKPEPFIYRSIMKRFGIQASQLAMLGDRLETDMAAGPQNGLFTILVMTGVTSREEVMRAEQQPDLIVERSLDLIPLLKESGGNRKAHATAWP
jgi:NagD protein